MTDNKKRKKALITGITGQDGAYLAELLIEKGYEVHGIKRHASLIKTDRIDELYEAPHVRGRNLILHYGDMVGSTNLTRIIQAVQPDEIYNLAAQSHVKVSFELPEYTANTDALGPLRILDAIRLLGFCDRIRFYQASTSELFGLVQETPQSEKTPFYPRSPYAAAKLYAYWITVNYREAYNMHASNGILFNHESPRRGKTFVTRKITQAVAHIALGLQDKVFLGNLDAKRDWGHAKDYVEAMYLMLQQDKADDYVIATGVTTSIRDFAKMAFAEIGVKLDFIGEGINEKAIVVESNHPEFQLEIGKEVIAIDPRYFRPTEVDLLVGDCSKAKEKLNWQPKYDLQTLVTEMVREDIKQVRKSSKIYNSSSVVTISGENNIL